MMSEQDRPNPEDLLEAIKREDTRSQKGRLKIFLGMAAGVGKTYAMLEAAQKLQSEGVDVVIGTVNTHGRKETAKLIEGLKIIPERVVEYKDIKLTELDLDEVLRIKPAIVLVDELAHTNVMGSRHPKRWQDVIEILDNGIDVYSALNVQHIESLKEIIEGVAGISIRETVPDSVIDAAAYIELIDLTPASLLQRLKEGRVYLGDQSTIAARNFFQEDRLTALREIVLRYAAEKVDRELHGMVSTAERLSGWRSRERLLVAVSHSLYSQKLIRTVRRLAFNLNAPWIALHVDTGQMLSDEENANLSKNLALARELGGDVIATSDSSVAVAIQRIARWKGVTQIVIGRAPVKSWFGFLSRFTILDQLVQECSDIDIHVIGQPTSVGFAYKRKWRKFLFLDKVSHYFIVLLLALAFLGLNGILLNSFGYEFTEYNVLIFILMLSLFFKKGPVLFASLLSSLFWIFFFAPYTHSPLFFLYHDDFMVGLFLLVALVTGVFTDREREHRERLIKRERSSQMLYEIVRDIANAPFAEVLKSVEGKLEDILNGKCQIIVKSIDDGLEFNHFRFSNDEKEKAAINWVFENSKEAGWSTSTLPSVKCLYIPLEGFHETVGAIAYESTTKRVLSVEEKNFLYTVCQQLALYIERLFSEERERRNERLNQIEKIHESIISLISRKFQKPINNTFVRKNEMIERSEFQEKERESKQIHRMEDSSEELLKTLDNISVMAKLSVGLIPINKKEHRIKDLIKRCCDTLNSAMSHHKLKITMDEKIPLIFFDFSLMELLIYNLFLNAINYSPYDSTIDLEAKMYGNTFVLSVADEGEEIPTNLLDTIFEEFIRTPEIEAANEIGLGLATAKMIADAHEGVLKAENRKIKGVKFSLYLSVVSQSVFEDKKD